MAGPLSISSAHSHVSSHDNDDTDLKAFFANGFDIQIADPDVLDKWVTHRFNICAATNVEDYELWLCIRMDFKKFEAKHFDMLHSSSWRRIREYCYPHGFWIDINNDTDTFTTGMLDAIASDWYEDWSLDQIKWVEKRYHSLSTVTCQLKQELTSTYHPDPASNLELNAAGQGTQEYPDMRYQTPPQQPAAKPNLYRPHQPTLTPISNPMLR